MLKNLKCDFSRKLRDPNCKLVILEQTAATPINIFSEPSAALIETISESCRVGIVLEICVVGHNFKRKKNKNFCPQLTLLHLWACLNSAWPKCFTTSSVSCVVPQQWLSLCRLMVIVSLLWLYTCWDGSSSKGGSFAARKTCLHCLFIQSK